jgi:hypothetical protein
VILTVTWWRALTDTAGRRESIRWDELAAELRRAGERPYRGDYQPGWSPAAFVGDARALAAVESVSAVCLDYDAGGDADALVSRWGAFAGVLHSTRKHTPEAPRYRLVLPLARSVTPAEFAALWPRVAAEAGSEVDEAPKDPSRFWYVPGSATGAALVWRELTGAPLDPDEWLRRPAPPVRVATPAPQSLTSIGSGNDIDRARAYIATMPAAISGSNGHGATWAVACKLVHGFRLSDADALAILERDYNPRCQPPWKPRELRHKVDSARRQASKLAGEVAARPWSPPAPWRDDDYVPEPPPGWRDYGEALPPDEWSDPDPRGEDGPIVDPVEQAERDAIQGEPRPPAPKTPTAPAPAKTLVPVLSMIEILGPVVDSMRTSGTLAPTGVPTGVELLDRAIGRYRPGNVTILGAKRSFGKTSFSLVNIDAALRSKHGLLVFACEDSVAMYGRRFMARRAGLNALSLRDMAEPFTGVQLRRAQDAVSEAEGEPFFVPALGMPVEDIAETVKAVAATRKVELVVVDYVQRIRARKSYPDRRLMVTGIVGMLVDAIKSVGAHSLLLSQLKRTEHRRPELEDLKESGDLEDMADHIILGHRERSQKSDVRSLIVAKNKDGIDDLPDIELDFDKLTASFSGRAWENGGASGNPAARGGKRDAPPPRTWTDPDDDYGIPAGF